MSELHFSLQFHVFRYLGFQGLRYESKIQTELTSNSLNAGICSQTTLTTIYCGTTGVHLLG